MFTPPPSPLPSKGAFGAAQEKPAAAAAAAASPLLAPPTPPNSEKQTSFTQSSAARDSKATKQQIGRRFRVAVLFVPIVLVAIALTAKALTGETWTLDVRRSVPPPFLRTFLADSPRRSHHRRAASSYMHKRQNTGDREDDEDEDDEDGDGSGSTTAARPTPTQPQTVPTIPAEPPVLPTPFPQPFDSGFQATFQTQACRAFFTNMTTSAPFRKCRPFSLLQPASNEFNTAQSNITQLNTLVWGTCNTPIDYGQCINNMEWFAAGMRRECATELAAGDPTTGLALIGLEGYQVGRESGCLSDPTTNSYCYVTAAAASTPQNLYYYALPAGTKIPPRTDPQCTSCLKSLMSIYSSALKGSPKPREDLPGLMVSYEKAAEITLGKCGVGYALTGVAESASAESVRGALNAGLWMTLVLGVGSAVIASGLL